MLPVVLALEPYGILTPTFVLSIATLGFASSFLNSEYTILALMISLKIFIACVPHTQAEWVGSLNPDPWRIKLLLSNFEYTWCILVALLTLLHVIFNPEYRKSACAFYLSSVGIAVAYDLFHMYVWLEVATFAFLGFCWGRQVLRQYWALQVFAAILVLLGTILIYQTTGTLTLPGAISGANDTAGANLWLLGWLVKSGVGLWLLQGYELIAAKDLFYVGSLFTKIGILALYKLPTIPLCIQYIGLMQFSLGVFLASTIDKHSKFATFAGMHLLAQNGLVLSCLSHSIGFEIYFLLHILAEALFLSVESQTKIHSVGSETNADATTSNWPPSRLIATVCVSGIPPATLFFIKLSLLQKAWWLAFSGVLTVNYIIRYTCASIAHAEIVPTQILCVVNVAAHLLLAWFLL